MSRSKKEGEVFLLLILRLLLLSRVGCARLAALGPCSGLVPGAAARSQDVLPFDWLRGEGRMLFPEFG